MLFYTGIARTASDVARSYVADIERPPPAAAHHEGTGGREHRHPGQRHGHPARFGELLHEAWQAKRSLSAAGLQPAVDDLYERARRPARSAAS